MMAVIFLGIARLVDLLSTWARDPDLRLEKNPLFRILGWRFNFWLNLALIAAAPALPTKFLVCLCVGSFVAAAWNVIGIIHDRNLSS